MVRSSAAHQHRVLSCLEGGSEAPESIVLCISDRITLSLKGLKKQYRATLYEQLILSMKGRENSSGIVQ